MVQVAVCVPVFTDTAFAPLQAAIGVVVVPTVVLKLTLPVGVTPVVGDTVAVKVTGAPAATEPLEVERDTLAVPAVMVSVPVPVAALLLLSAAWLATMG